MFSGLICKSCLIFVLLTIITYLLLRERILEFRDESQRLDQSSRLYDSSISNNGFEFDASHMVQVISLCSYFYDDLIT